MADQAPIPTGELLIKIAWDRLKRIKVEEPGLNLKERLGYALEPLIKAHQEVLSELNKSVQLLEDSENRAAEVDVELFQLRLQAVDVPQTGKSDLPEPELPVAEVSAVGSEGQVFLNIETVKNLHLSITNIADTDEDPEVHKDGPRVNELSDFELASILYKRLGDPPAHPQEGMSMNGNRRLGTLNAFHYGPNREHYKH